MRALTLGLALLALGGCQDREKAALASVEQRVCACKDAACAETAMKDIPGGHIKATYSEQELARSMLDCYAKLTDAQRPSTDPDAAGSAQ